MKTLLAWMLMCSVVVADNTFGLGEPEPTTVSAASAETFGLGVDAGPTPGKDATAAKDGIFSNSVIFPNRKIELVIAGKVQNIPDEETSGLLPITRRSQNNWTDPDVGMWNAANLREHLLGDFQSPVHRGSVPLSQLQGRSLSDLIAIHANLHEGWNWDGTSKQQLQVATIKERLIVPQPTIRSYRTVDNCPSGTCPTGGQQSFRLFRRR